MRRLWQFLTHRWVVRPLVLALALALALLASAVFETDPLWAIGSVLAAAALCWLAPWAWRRYRARAADPLARAIAEPSGDARDEVPALRRAMLEAVGKIKTSKLGIMRGSAALYELPWYMIIGNPAAGKSSAITHSGLTFPLAGARALHGVGGTRNCDWFFTTEGIVLDTAGRYSVEDSDRAEWLAFLGLLRRYRPRAPINGIIIAASLAELVAGPPQKNLELARNLRTRVQELTEHLGVYAPVYVVFTKADLVAGFCDFFHGAQGAERDRPWGATIRYNRRRAHQDVLSFFDQGFEELHEGLKEMSLASMGMPEAMRPGVFTFPLEFASMKPVLRAFLATLFEENTYQFRPVFRGFYFTSALQEGSVANLASQRVASRFNVELPKQQDSREEEGAGAGFFLRDLFRGIVFADKDLVSRYTSPARTRIKYGAFVCAALTLGVALAGWSWSYSSNRQLAANVEADLAKVVQLQDKRSDLQSRLEALEILQDRIEQLEKYRADTPLMLSFGLYQGDTLERKLRDEYFAGVRDVMVRPVGTALEALLAEMNAQSDKLDPATQDGAGAGKAAGQPYQAASPTNVADTYNALKAYLMLGDKTHAETGHLYDQVTRFWRVWLDANRGDMPRERMVRSAERLLTFHIANVADPAWPQLQLKIGLLDTARENLRRVVRGIPARERVYADIRARASTRYPAVTVARLAGQQDAAFIAGSHAVPGAFTREAWEGFVHDAIREAASKELASTDWVLRTSTNDDLTLEGSPEQIEKELTGMYKADYVKQWNSFVQGVTLAGFDGFDGGIRAMNRLGDPQTSPVSRVLTYVHEQTSWDGPGGGSAAAAKAQKGVIAWLREKILRRAPSDVRTGVDAAGLEIPVPGGGGAGRIAAEFSGLARIVGVKEKDATLLSGYLDALSKVRSRLNQLKNQGDPGPGARQFMQQTLDGSGSELAEALKFVDEQMLTGMGDGQKQALRPILVRPLMQTFSVVIGPSESEINRTWMAQVVEPFRKSLAAKYPFASRASLQASPEEIGQVFGPDGGVAKFVSTSLGSLVVRRGDLLEPRRWAEMGIALSPHALAAFPSWVAPLAANGVASGEGSQLIFQVRPLLSPGVQEFSVEIDGQQVRYRNGQPAWTSMVYPGPGMRGVRISAVLMDGRTVDLFNEAGPHALVRMIRASDQTKRDAYNELRWKSDGVVVALDFKKVVSSADAGEGSRGFTGMSLPDSIVGHPPEQLATSGGAQ